MTPIGMFIDDSPDDQLLPPSVEIALMLAQEGKRIAREDVARYRRKRQPQVKQDAPRPLWATAEDRRDGLVMAEITPALLSPEERAACKSVNGKMKKLLGDGL